MKEDPVPTVGASTDPRPDRPADGLPDGLYRGVFDSGPAAFLVAGDGTLLRMNSAALGMLGLRDGHSGTLDALLGSDGAGRLLEPVPTGPVTLDTTTFDGEPVSMEFSSMPVRGTDEAGQGRTYHVAVRDVTPERRREQRLRFLAVLAENSLDAILVCQPDGTASYVSPSIESLLGYQPEDLLGRRPGEFMHPDDMEEQTLAFQEVLSSPDGVGHTLSRFMHRDGSWRWIEGVSRNMMDHPDVQGILNTGRDVTARKEAEAEIVRLNSSLETRVREQTNLLAESEDLFRTTFEQVGVGLAHVLPDGKFVRVNQKLCEITGYSAPEMLSMRFHDITHSDDLPEDVENLGRLIVGEIPAYMQEKRYVRKDYTQVWVALTVTAVRDEEGRARYLISAVEDIGERKRAEDQRRSLTPREIEVLRLIARGWTNPRIAKELNVSLGTVKLHAQHIYSRLGVVDRAQAAARAVEIGIIPRRPDAPEGID